MSRPARLSLLIILLSVASPAPTHAASPSFRTHVMPVLSRAGCNQGTCHGNKNGKGGFQLSLRGEDAAKDFATMTRGDGGRRVNPLDPARSLLLLKPSMSIPHEGGRRFHTDDRSYRILHDWIAAGMPFGDDEPLPSLLEVSPIEALLEPAHDSVKVSATAIFDDGRRQDVTDLVVFESSSLLAETSGDGTVRLTGPGEVTVTVRYLEHQVPVRLAYVPDRRDFVWSAPEPTNFVDELAFAKLRRLKVNPSAICDDATFVRRAHLDLLGLLPTADEARAFVADDSSDKRTRLVDELLARPEFATFWGLKWSDLLRAEEKTLDEKGIRIYVEWIRQSLAENKPLDRFAREFVSARGSTYEVPPANFYRAMRDPITRAETVAQLFLGVRLQCAKCHNHPFDRWTQNDYYGWANNFSQIEYEIKENNRKDENDKHEFVGEQVVILDPKQKPVLHPDTDEAIPPRFIDASGAVPDPNGDRLEQLAAWLTSPDNKQFARIMTNRVWTDLLGRGIVDPTDDFRATNPPVNPELLDALADALVGSGFDLRHLIRTIMASRVYQLSSETNAANAGDELNFSHAIVRRLSAEQLLDAMTQATGSSIEFGGYEAGTRAAEIMGVRSIHDRRGKGTAGDRFLKTFGKPPRLTPCDCERTDETTLAQTFRLMSGDLIDGLLNAEQNRLAGMSSSELTPEQIVDELYWSSLTRGPTDEEKTAAVAYISAAEDRRQALQDLMWALLNSTEFLLRR
ncbi:MAG: DUF1549 and DUF1553 domain-containing protein [Planctomycetota bacterium]|nr:DUF1549 and DUF1553 domain-containing protein [Planctomycetota bacterium]